jgi:hypothetical protein
MYLSGFSVNNFTLMASPSRPASSSTMRSSCSSDPASTRHDAAPLHVGARKIGFTVLTIASR